ncbi:MAG: hypothetical protein PF488_02295 [Patescibacteria group bacterium]|jgi:hypothetical protein|nr:hypothetical protein [Patescibacteria group bacterium]
MKKYKIGKNYLILNDRESVKFHIKKEDYFGTIATILSLIEQDLKNVQAENEEEVIKIEKTLKNLEKDLLYLQKNYQINSRQLY